MRTGGSDEANSSIFCNDRYELAGVSDSWE